MGGSWGNASVLVHGYQGIHYCGVGNVDFLRETALTHLGVVGEI